MTRRFALIRVLFVALAGAAAGCFALFPLDDYGPGNGGVDGGVVDGASTSSSSSGSSGEASVDPNTRHVFITSTQTNGDFLGAHSQPQDLDELCNLLAADAGLSGKYKIWVSLPSESAAVRFFGDAAPPDVHYVDMEGRAIVASWNQLFETGRLQSAIDVDEHGRHLSTVEIDAGVGTCSANVTLVWANTTADGGVADPDTGCNGWMNEGQQNGRVGVVTGQPTTWTDACQMPCSFNAHVYCFEQ